LHWKLQYSGICCRSVW
jgi:hypothetical protein